MRGDDWEWNVTLAMQNAYRWADEDWKLACRILSEWGVDMMESGGAGFGRYGGPLDGLRKPKNKMPPEEAIETSLGK